MIGFDLGLIWARLGFDLVYAMLGLGLVKTWAWVGLGLGLGWTWACCGLASGWAFIWSGQDLDLSWAWLRPCQNDTWTRLGQDSAKTLVRLEPRLGANFVMPVVFALFGFPNVWAAVEDKLAF